MERYIGEQRLLDVLERNFGHTGGAAVLKQLIQEQPTVDVEEVHHGKWVYCGSDVRRCSYCGHEVSPAQADLYKGCPICRAKMDRKKG